jgi:hypothetical protein
MLQEILRTRRESLGNQIEGEINLCPDLDRAVVLADRVVSYKEIHKMVHDTGAGTPLPVILLAC